MIQLKAVVKFIGGEIATWSEVKSISEWPDFFNKAQIRISFKNGIPEAIFDKDDIIFIDLLLHG